MYARVVKIDGDALYVEVDSQLRFAAPCAPSALLFSLLPNDQIEFHIERRHGRPRILIDAVVAARSRDRDRTS